MVSIKKKKKSLPNGDLIDLAHFVLFLSEAIGQMLPDKNSIYWLLWEIFAR